jgi:hypothetical protein
VPGCILILDPAPEARRESLTTDQDCWRVVCCTEAQHQTGSLPDLPCLMLGTRPADPGCPVRQPVTSVGAHPCTATSLRVRLDPPHQPTQPNRASVICVVGVAIVDCRPRSGLSTEGQQPDRPPLLQLHHSKVSVVQPTGHLPRTRLYNSRSKYSNCCAGSCHY